MEITHPIYQKETKDRPGLRCSKQIRNEL